jgi:hypothetical protein
MLTLPDNLHNYVLEIQLLTERLDGLVTVYLEGDRPELGEVIDSVRNRLHETMGAMERECANLVYVAETKMGIICRLCGGQGRFDDILCPQCDGSGRRVGAYNG